MPEIRYYTVTQKRMVRVTADSPSDAILVANAVFKGENPGNTLGGSILTPVREIDISAGEEI